MVIEVWNIVCAKLTKTNQQRKKLNSFPLEFQQFNEHFIANMDKNFLNIKNR